MISTPQPLLKTSAISPDHTSSQPYNRLNSSASPSPSLVSISPNGHHAAVDSAYNGAFGDDDRRISCSSESDDEDITFNTIKRGVKNGTTEKNRNCEHAVSADDADPGGGKILCNADVNGDNNGSKESAGDDADKAAKTTAESTRKSSSSSAAAAASPMITT